MQAGTRSCGEYFYTQNILNTNCRWALLTCVIKAMASTNHLPSHRLRLLYRLRQQLRSNRRCHRASDFQKQICARIYCSIRRGYGPCSSLRDFNSGDVVGDLGHRARHEATEAGQNCRREERRGHSGGCCRQGFEASLE